MKSMSNEVLHVYAEYASQEVVALESMQSNFEEMARKLSPDNVTEAILVHPDLIAHLDMLNKYVSWTAAQARLVAAHLKTELR